MKTLSVVAVFITALTMSIMAQTEPLPNAEIFWGPADTCSPLNDASVIAASPKCELVQVDQGTFYILSYKGLSVAVSYSRRLGYISATTQLTNRSGQKQFFDPLLSRIDVFDSRSAFLKGQVGQRVLSGISSETAKDLYVKADANYSVSDRPFIGGTKSGNDSQSEPTTVTYIEENGRLTGVTSAVPNSPTRSGETRIVVDQPTKAAPAPVSRRSTAPADPTKIASFNKGIKLGTIDDQQKVAGYLFFETTTEPSKYFVMRIKLGNMVFVFPDETFSEKNKLLKKN